MRIQILMKIKQIMNITNVNFWKTKSQSCLNSKEI